VQANDITTVLVATKIDKVRPSRLAGRRQQLSKACNLHEGDIFWVSASKGTGLDALRSHVELLLTPDT
jgi:selenocysteine-specific translation elongation factor